MFSIEAPFDASEADDYIKTFYGAFVRNERIAFSFCPDSHTFHLNISMWISLKIAFELMGKSRPRLHYSLF